MHAPQHRPRRGVAAHTPRIAAVGAPLRSGVVRPRLCGRGAAVRDATPATSAWPANSSALRPITNGASTLRCFAKILSSQPIFWRRASPSSSTSKTPCAAPVTVLASLAAMNGLDARRRRAVQPKRSNRPGPHGAPAGLRLCTRGERCRRGEVWAFRRPPGTEI